MSHQLQVERQFTGFLFPQLLFLFLFSMVLDVLTPNIVFSSQSLFSEVLLHPCTLLPIFSRLLPSTSPVSTLIMASNTIPPRPRGQRQRDTKETQTAQPAQPAQATQGPQTPMVNILASDIHYPTSFTQSEIQCLLHFKLTKTGCPGR